MLSTAFLTIAGIVLAGFAAAVAALMVVTALCPRRDPESRAAARGPAVFLFEGGALADASEAANEMLAGVPRRGTDLERVTARLGARYPELRLKLADPSDRTETIAATDGSGHLTIERSDTRLCLSLDSAPPVLDFEPDRHSVSAMAEELETLRSVAELTRVPIWRQSRDSRILWANAAYLDLAECVASDDTPIWPPRALFDETAFAEMESMSSRRMWLETGPDGEGHWYDCHAAAAGDDLLVTAIPADPVVKAEDALREFVQTLTKTFAHLSVGLAIFDRRRRLALFNPALTDLFPLPVEMLSARPTLTAFLDQLRERRLMPEPKDYKSWRQQLSELEAAAADGSYSETWSLPSGQTYRVTGRPHADGGVAFLFEDISAEIGLTRRFRAEIETGQAVLDRLDEAIAVFSAGGVLIMANKAYAELWSVDPATTLGDIGVAEATRRWLELCQPTPVWGDAREFVSAFGERADWTAEVMMRNGRPLSCRFEALPGGATLVGFQDAARGRSRAAAPELKRISG